MHAEVGKELNSSRAAEINTALGQRVSPAQLGIFKSPVIIS
jgi:hypothetical protein